MLVFIFINLNKEELLFNLKSINVYNLQARKEFKALNYYFSVTMN